MSTPAAVAAMLRDGDAAAWLGERASRPAGFSMARVGAGDVFALFVVPAFEGQGLGSLLLHEAERWLALRGGEEARLLTGAKPSTRAPGFYAARDWRVADGRIGFTKQAPGTGHDPRPGAASASHARAITRPGTGRGETPNGGHTKIVLQGTHASP